MANLTPWPSCPECSRRCCATCQVAMGDTRNSVRRAGSLRPQCPQRTLGKGTELPGSALLSPPTPLLFPYHRTGAGSAQTLPTHTHKDTHSMVRRLCLVDTKFAVEFYLSGLTAVCGWGLSTVWVGWGLSHCVGKVRSLYVESPSFRQVT